MEQLLHRTAASFSPFGGCLIINISISLESTYYASSLGSRYYAPPPIVISLAREIVWAAFLTGQGGGRQGRSVNINVRKKCILSRMKPTDKERESIESTSTSEMPSMQCHRQLSGT